MLETEADGRRHSVKMHKKARKRGTLLWKIDKISRRQKKNTHFCVFFVDFMRFLRNL